MTTIRAAADAAARAAVAARTEQLFREAGSLREGHFALKSGRHADQYLEKFQVLQYPGAVSELCGFLSAGGRDAEGRTTVDAVAGPTTGGVILAFEVARQLGVRGIFAEEVRDADGTRRRAFRRGFRIERGERVLVVDDILTTGGSVLAMLPPIEEAGGDVRGVAVLVDRSGGMEELVSPSGATYPLASLWALDLPTYEPGPACPGCASATPLQTPGASGTGANAGTSNALDREPERR